MNEIKLKLCGGAIYRAAEKRNRRAGEQNERDM